MGADSSHTLSLKYGVVFLVYLVLTAIVWGLFALDRAMWWDEIWVMSVVQSHAGEPLKQLFGVKIQSPTRILLPLPFTLALWLGAHAPFLQIIYGLTWLLLGIAAHFLVREIFPSRPVLAYLAGSLTLTATGDTTVNSSGMLPLQLSILYYFLSLLCLVRWWLKGTKKALLPAGIFLLLSVWTYDASFAAIVLTPLLLWTLDDFRMTRRLAKAALFWYGLLVPYFIVFFSFILDPTGYASVALVKMSLHKRLFRTLELFLYNFTPWRWGLDKLYWFPPRPSIVPKSLVWALTGAGALIFLTGAALLRTKGRGAGYSSEREPRHLLVFFLVCLIMALASNAIYSSVQFSEFFFRSQLVSRIWTSLAIAVIAYGLGTVLLKRPSLTLLLPAVFVIFGIYAGLKRQDYYLGYWWHHQEELHSIVEQVPGIKSDAVLILHIPEVQALLATEATYLARSWLSYLYGDPSLGNRVFLWSTERKVECKTGADGFMCQSEDDRNLWTTISYDKAILLTYDPSENRYLLEHDLASVTEDDRDKTATAYNPRALIVNRSLPEYAHALLNGRGYLGALLRAGQVRAARRPDISRISYDSSKVNIGLLAGSIDIVESDSDLSTMKRAGAIRLAGWAFDPKTQGIVKSIVIVNNGKPLEVVPIVLQRADVAAALNRRELASSGWETVLQAKRLEKGANRLEFYAILSDGTFAPLQTSRGATSLEISLSSN